MVLCQLDSSLPTLEVLTEWALPEGSVLLAYMGDVPWVPEQWRLEVLVELVQGVLQQVEVHVYKGPSLALVAERAV